MVPDWDSSEEQAHPDEIVNPMSHTHKKARGDSKGISVRIDCGYHGDDQDTDSAADQVSTTASSRNLRRTSARRAKLCVLRQFPG